MLGTAVSLVKKFAAPLTDTVNLRSANLKHHLWTNALPTWDPSQYAQFASERARPCRDLITAIGIDSPRRIVDLGCGPANSTAMLAQRWPTAEILGIDSSPEMLETARLAGVHANFEPACIKDWARQSSSQPSEWDIVFSNAALHWVPDHATLFPALMQRVKSNGALAVQMPSDLSAPAHTTARDLAETAGWREQFAAPIKVWHVHPPDFYYDTLAGCARHIDIWSTEYLHVLPSVESITEWYCGSGLRPYLDALRTLGARNEFLAQYTDRLRASYPVRADGRVLLPFRRLFIVAYR